MTSDGSVDEAALEKLSDINPVVTSEESLNYLKEEVASYEGETGQYTENENARLFQEALKKLEYDLGNFGPNKDGIDGKFGPKTKTALSGKGITTFTDADVPKICSSTKIETPKDEFTTQVDADNVDDILNM